MSIIQSIKEKLLFLVTGIKDHSQVVSFAPSSPSLTKAMLEKIDFAKAKVILEYGPGTGTFTKEMLKKGGPDLMIIAFELNPTFFKYIQDQIKDPRLICLNQGAETSLNYLEEQGIQGADYIVSSLPFSHISEEVRITVLSQAAKILKGKGSFNHYRYNSKFIPELSKYFSKVEMKTVIMNLPPAYVYSGSD